jgi:hypothetical protein
MMLCVTHCVRSWPKLQLLLMLVGLAIPFWGQDSVAFKTQDPGKGSAGRMGLLTESRKTANEIESRRDG